MPNFHCEKLEKSTMKRFLACALMLSAVSGFGLVGCGEESKVKTTETESTPGGSTTTTKEVKVNSKGDNPPTNSAGETGKTGSPTK
jgi:hypothetical protein